MPPTARSTPATRATWGRWSATRQGDHAEDHPGRWRGPRVSSTARHRAVVLAVVLVGYLLIVIDVVDPDGGPADRSARPRVLAHEPLVGAERLHPAVRRAALARRARRRPRRP